MKKIIVFVLLLMPLAFVVNAQKSSTKKMQVIDRSYNPVRHWRIYVFETVDQQPMDITKLKASLLATKGVQRVDPSAETMSKRILIYADEKMMLSKSVELKNAFTNAGVELSNIPVETK